MNVLDQSIYLSIYQLINWHDQDTQTIVKPKRDLYGSIHLYDQDTQTIVIFVGATRWFALRSDPVVRPHRQSYASLVASAQLL